ncbi:MAG: PotD/PotF family extracellular solute-binding protein [Alphaproteobacteria bacterium]
MTHARNESGLIRVRSMMQISRRRFGLGTAAVGGLAAAGLRPRRALAATDVTFLGWQGYDEGLFVDDFMAENDINLNTTYIGNNDEIVTKLASGGLGSIDIVTPYMGYIPLLAESGLVQPIDESKVPNLASVMPIFRNDPNISVDGVLYGVPFTWGSAPMMYNPAVTGGVPQSWMDLFKPEYEGKVGMMDDPMGNLMLAAIIATDAESATDLTHDQLRAAVDFLIEVKAISRVVTVSWGDMADSLARGDIDITFSGWETIKKFAADLGAEIDYTYPQEGTFAWLDTFSIATDAPNLEVDHMLCNKIISPEAQVVIGGEWLQGIVNSEAVAQLEPEAASLYPYDDMDSFGERATFFAFPPLEEGEGLATFDEWMEEYERFKVA